MKIKLWLGATGLLLCLLAHPVVAGQFEDAVAAYHRQDYQTAFKLTKPLAEQGYPAAEVNLGWMYSNGQGVPQDYAKAIDWFRKAAEQGNEDGQNNVGYMYDKGFGFRQNYAKAIEWYSKAAEQGNGNAQNNLGAIYAQGHGVPQDYVQAHVWFNLSAAGGNDTASKSRDLITKSMTPDQIAEAQRLAREWLAAHPKP